MCGCGNNYLQTMTGLMIGIGNRLRSKTGGRGHSPSSPSPSSLVGTTEHLPPRVTRKSSVKRKGAEIHGTAVKRCVNGCGVWVSVGCGWDMVVMATLLLRPALISGAADTPASNAHSLFTPLGNRKKRKTLLSRRRHTDQTKPRPSRQQGHHQIFNPPIMSGVKLDFANQATNKMNRYVCGKRGCFNLEGISYSFLFIAILYPLI